MGVNGYERLLDN